jgi:hypothetical protein
MSSALNLIVVVVQASDVSTGELSNLSGRAANTTSNIKDLVSIFDANLSSKVVFVAGDGLVETLAICETAEVKGLAPAILVKVGCEVVVAGLC